MAQPRNDLLAAGSPQTFVTFWLQGGLFGIATAVVKEIAALPPLTPIPHAPAAVRGYVNLRGHIVLVVDLNCLLRRELTAPGPESQLIVFKPDLGEAFAILVEQIGDIVELSAARIETSRAGHATSDPELHDRPQDELIRGVGKLDGALLSILDAHALLASLEWTVASGGTAAARCSLAPVKETTL